MKVIHYTDAKTTRFDNEVATKVTGRVVIGQADGAKNFCMRVFELEAGGYTPRHQHDWEHEIFFHAGQGEVWKDGAWLPVQAGSVVFVPGNQEHQIRSSGSAGLTFVCLVPSGAPEM